MAKGYDKSLAEGIFEMLIPFAGYGFNKSQRRGVFRFLAYKTAYSRANFPVEFMAATLTNEIGNPTAFRGYINELERMGIRLLPPQINSSERYFSVAKQDIVFWFAGHQERRKRCC